ncbi:MAG: DNA polymerase, partial [Solirubrobacterales bacterium]
VLQIHDELLFEGPEAEAETVRDLAIEEMVGAFELDPPLEVDAGIGPDWLSVKEACGERCLPTWSLWEWSRSVCSFRSRPRSTASWLGGPARSERPWSASWSA